MSKSIPILRHVAHESAGTVENVLQSMSLPFHYVDFFDRVPESLDWETVPGLVVMGGPMNVDEVERYPHLAREVVWIQEALALGLPILGICLGAQLLAKALGSRVYPLSEDSATMAKLKNRSERRKEQPPFDSSSSGEKKQVRIKEIGWYSVDLTRHADNDPLFEGCGKRLSVFHWHGDTFDLPRSSVSLAESALCRNQAFRYGRSAYGLQFHPEMTAEMIEAWLAEPLNCVELSKLEEVDPQTIREQTLTELPVLQSVAEKIFSRFFRLCSKRIFGCR